MKAKYNKRRCLFMEKAKITEPRFELVSSSIEGYKEVQVIFNYQGEDKKYFVFVKEGKKVNYIKEAKKEFKKDFDSGKVVKLLKHGSKGAARPWLIATASVLGVAAITLGGLFLWKALTKINYNPGDSVEVTPEVVVPAGSTYSVNIENTKAKVGQDYHTDITLGSSNLNDEEECYLPDKPVSVISGVRALKADEYKYTLSSSKLSATLDIEGKYVYGPIFVNLVVSTSGESTIPWYLDDSYLDSLTLEDVGIINKVKVNGINHKVRLIGIDHDELADDSGDLAHTTWEFANLISDENGYSLATFWNDTTETDVPCRDYYNSSLRYALIGEQEDPTVDVSHGWYEKGMGTKSETYTKPVIDMLPSELAAKILPVEKEVITYNGSSYITTTCEDKLFVLSSSETNEDGYVWERYDYYYYSPSTTTGDYHRVKGQVKKTDALESATPITDSLASGAESIAGYNSSYANCGSGYWLRDIETDEVEGKGSPYGMSSGGSMCNIHDGGHGDGNLLATPIAPAFCL